MKFRIIQLGILVVVSNFAHAVPLNVSESADFDNSPSTPTTFSLLDIGENLVSGQLSDSETGVDAWFAPTVSGGFISTVSLEVSNYHGTIHASSATYSSGSGTPVDDVDFTGDGTYLLTPNVFFSSSLESFYVTSNNGGRFDYIWHVVVEANAVPEPATGLLLITGLLLLSNRSLFGRRFTGIIG